MIPGLSIPLGAGSIKFDEPGSVTFNGNTQSTWSFTVPNYKNTLVVHLYGAGGAGAYVRWDSDFGNNVQHGSVGTASTCSQLGMTAGGGGRATAMPAAVGAGGVASGGVTNTNGSPGTQGTTSVGGVGGNAAASGPGKGGNGVQDGQLGTGYTPGGGGGAYSARSHSRGGLTPGSTLSGNVGQRGVGFLAQNHGGWGRVVISWS